MLGRNADRHASRIRRIPVRIGDWVRAAGIAVILHHDLLLVALAHVQPVGPERNAHRQRGTGVPYRSAGRGRPIRPHFAAPIRLRGASTPGSVAAFSNTLVSAVSISSAFTSIGPSVWFFESSSAATPAVMGQANDVPLSVVMPLPVPGCAASIVPGALMSGFSML